VRASIAVMDSGIDWILSPSFLAVTMIVVISGFSLVEELGAEST
jgi:hypothetical protein